MKEGFFDIEIYADVAKKFFESRGITRYKTKKIDEMNDKEVITACHSWYEENGLQGEYKEFEKIYCPDWYWYGGLHDAEIIEINELTLEPNYKEKPFRYNCLEILLDGKGTRFYTDIKKIELYNYKVLSGSLPDSNEKKVWWLRDRLTAISSNKYRLELILEQARGNHISLEIKFMSARSEYNQ